MPATDETRQSPDGGLPTGDTPLVVVRTAEVRSSTVLTLANISPRLRPRDRAIAALLHEHTTLTT
ncbi:hypothetical protein, partial [Cryptosporangium minutisporangium]|uniref:hypothetical protein n=1 Tax=Cryptosporangium minutisporangium TaxID=113569 RepID=UPI0031EEDFA8